MKIKSPDDVLSGLLTCGSIRRSNVDEIRETTKSFGVLLPTLSLSLLVLFGVLGFQQPVLFLSPLPANGAPLLLLFLRRTENFERRSVELLGLVEVHPKLKLGVDLHLIEGLFDATRDVFLERGFCLELTTHVVEVLATSPEESGESGLDATHESMECLHCLHVLALLEELGCELKLVLEVRTNPETFELARELEKRLELFLGLAEGRNLKLLGHNLSLSKN